MESNIIRQPSFNVMVIGILMISCSVVGFILNSNEAKIALQAGVQGHYSLVFFWGRMSLVSLIILLASRLKIIWLVVLSVFGLLWIVIEYTKWRWSSSNLAQAAEIAQLPEPNLFGLFGATWLEGVFFFLAIGLSAIVIMIIFSQKLKK